MALSRNIVLFLMSLCLTRGYVIQDSRGTNASSLPMTAQHVRRADADPADFSWIRRWAAIGDSFTAGIGSGNLYSQENGDYKCSRYDHSYPAIVNNALGPSVQNFQYLACSGDRSAQIYDQVSNMQGNVDMVMMTAGGNDLCLVNLIHLHVRNINH